MAQDIIANIEEIINALPDRFTSHQFIIEYASKHQHEYIQNLNENLDSERPFASLHSKIGKQLKRLSHETGKLKHIDDVSDAGIFGKSSQNALWEKTAK